MKIAEQPLRLHPQKCVVTGRIDGEMIDFDAIPDCQEPPAIVIMAAVVKEAGIKYCDLVPGERLRDLESQVEIFKLELEKLQRINKATEELEELLPQQEPINA